MEGDRENRLRRGVSGLARAATVPHIDWHSLPRGVRGHLEERLRLRQLSKEDLLKLMDWIRGNPEVPDDAWCKDFGTFQARGTRRSALLVSRKGTAVLRQEDLSQSGRAFVDGPCEGEGARVRGSMRLECSLGCRDNSGCGNVSEGVGFGTKKKVNKSLQTWPMKSVRKLSIIF